MANLNIKITKTQHPKTHPDSASLGFGQHFTDHMFIMDYDESKGWYNERILPYGPIEISPAATVLHYGQANFEGMKAYRNNGKTYLFRPKKNFERLSLSNERICIPHLDVDVAMSALKAFLKVDESWIPTEKGTSLYIRPFVIAVDPYLGVKPSHTYQFIIIASPVGAYYPEGINPVKIYVEPNYVRSVRGGVGYAKTVGNYAASLKAQLEAKEKNYTQVLWLDAIERKYIEEVGTMNVFFVIGDEVITPSLEGGSILPGITRDSVITLLRHWGYKVSERKLSIEEVFNASKNGTLKEAFGTGTAAVISPIGELFYNGEQVIINNMQTGELSSKIYNTISSIQYGLEKDPFDWIEELK